MKFLKRFQTIVILLMIQLAITGFDSASYAERRETPMYSGELVIPGLKDEVTVFTDERGMPHIYAVNEHDLYLATGYITARERLWQMDLIRRSSAGRLSEIFGESYVQSDIFMRCLRIGENSEKILEKQPPEIIECLEAYTDGVNAFINSHKKHLPLEFRLLSYSPEEWTLKDVVNIVGNMGWNLTSRNLTSELFYYELAKKLGFEKAAQLIPGWKIEAPSIYPGFKLDSGVISETLALASSAEKQKELGIASFSGSNNWAVAGSRTETGMPLLSNDMHLPFGVPSIWMQVHQVVPEKLNVTGVLIPGEPFIIAGHNERIAWGMTNLMVDDLDLYAEKVNPGNHSQYSFNGRWTDMKVTTEIIRIRKQPCDTVRLRFTHRGPIISDYRNIHESSLSMRWSGNDPGNEIRSMYLINRAEDWDQFREGLSTFRAISQNFIYADIEGNIGLSSGGGIPLRKGDGCLIRNGETGEFDWRGYVPFDQLPYSYNPANGHVSSANNKTADDDYPYYISSEFVMPYRIIRIRSMLEEKERYGTEDFTRMINDQYSEYARLLTPYILKAAGSAVDLTVQESRILDTLSVWDHTMRCCLISPTIFECFRLCFRKNLLADELEGLYDNLYYMTGEYYMYRILTSGPDEWVNNINTPHSESFNDIILKSYREAVDSLNHSFGRNIEKWEYGKNHSVTFTHPLGSLRILDRLFSLNSRKYPVGGSDHTVSPYFSFGQILKVNHGSSQRHIFNTADWDESLTVIPGGESGVPSSEFYLSQVERYIAGEFYKDPFSENAVRSAAKYTLKLIPEKY